MKHRILVHNTGRNQRCETCGRYILIGHHYFSTAHNTLRGNKQKTRHWHEGCLVDAHGDPFPCPDKDLVLRLRDHGRYSTPLFPVRPLEVMKGKQDGNNQRD